MVMWGSEAALTVLFTLVAGFISPGLEDGAVQCRMTGALASETLVSEPAGGSVALPLIKSVADGEVVGCPLVAPRNVRETNCTWGVCGALWLLGECSEPKIWLPAVPGEAGIDGGGLPERPIIAKPSPGSALSG